jgi:hypothetical protein
VAVGKNIGLDDHLLAGDTFDWEAPAVDLGRDALDHDAASP